MAEIADIPEEIPDILIIRVDVLILFHRIRQLMYIRRRPIWGEGRWGKFYFCINPFDSTCYDSADIFSSSFICTIIQLRLVQLVVNLNQQFPCGPLKRGNDG